MGGLICLKNIEDFLKRTSERYSMLKITRDGEKTIDKERQFNKSLLPRWKQKWLVFKLGLVIYYYPNIFFKLRKKVLTRLDQIDINIIDTTLDERIEIAKWFARQDGLVGITKEENSKFYTLFYEKRGNIVKEHERDYNTPITDEIDKQMIDGYIYSISDLLTYNAPCKVEK